MVRAYDRNINEVAAQRARVGIVGVGRWGRNLVRAFDGLVGCDVRLVCDLHARKLADPALPPGARRSTDPSATLADPSIDAVIIATPARAHAAHALAALEAGKHVFVEKPMALSLRDAKMMSDAASRASRHLMVGHLMRYHPAISELERLIQAGVLGNVRHVVALRLGPKASSSDEGPWWSLAPHDVSLVRSILRADVYAASASEHVFPDGTSTISARLRLSKGAAWLVVSTGSHRKVRRLVVFGSRAAAVFDDGVRPRLTLLPGSQGLPGVLRAMEAPPSSLLEGDPLPLESGTPVVFREEEPLTCEAAHFISAVLGESSIRTDAHEGCCVTAVLEAGAQSIARGGGWARVAPLASPQSSYSHLDGRRRIDSSGLR